MDRRTSSTHENPPLTIPFRVSIGRVLSQMVFVAMFASGLVHLVGRSTVHGLPAKLLEISTNTSRISDKISSNLLSIAQQLPPLDPFRLETAQVGEKTRYWQTHIQKHWPHNHELIEILEQHKDLQGTILGIVEQVHERALNYLGETINLYDLLDDRVCGSATKHYTHVEQPSPKLQWNLTMAQDYELQHNQNFCTGWRRFVLDTYTDTKPSLDAHSWAWTSVNLDTITTQKPWPNSWFEISFGGHARKHDSEKSIDDFKRWFNATLLDFSTLRATVDVFRQAKFDSFSYCDELQSTSDWHPVDDDMEVSVPSCTVLKLVWKKPRDRAKSSRGKLELARKGNSSSVAN